MNINLTAEVIGAAIEVHKTLGPGLLESVYQRCLCYELSKRKISFQKEVPLDLYYKNMHLGMGYRIDMLVESELILELKCVEQILPIHVAQLLTYMKLSHKKLGLILNFHVPVMKEGIKRLIL